MDLLSILLGSVLGAFLSWPIAKYFATRSTKDVERKIDEQTSQLNFSPTFTDFEKMLRTAAWHHREIDDDDVWVCEKNNLFQFRRSTDKQRFREKWTSVFPDQEGSLYVINLMIGQTIVQSFRFVSVDSSRYTLPLPHVTAVNDEQVFCWYEDSVEVLIAEIIGNYYHYNSIREVAAFTKVVLAKGTKPVVSS